MKTVEPYAWTGNPELAKDGRLGHWIKQTDTDTGQVVWKEISKAEWDSLWEGEQPPTMRQLQERLRALAARHGLESDPPRPHKPLMEELAEIRAKYK